MLLNPIHDPARDEPLDFSDIEQFNPKRVPLPGQAHVITAMVKGMRSGCKGGFNSGEMGVGKSLMGAVAAYKYCNGRGRVLVMCPDHTIDKWAEEIKSTIPNCRVLTFDNWKEVVHYSWTIMDTRKSGAKRWIDPVGMEYVIVGRDQSKRLPTSCPNMGEEKNCFDGQRREHVGSFKRLIGWEDAKDEYGNTIWDADEGKIKREPVYSRIYRCPSCGNAIMDRKKGIPIDVAASKDGICCDGRYAVEIKKDGSAHGKDRILLTGSAFASAPEGKLVSLDHFWSPYMGSTMPDPHKKYVIRKCNEPLWNYIAKPNWWAPAWYIHKKMRGCFDFAVLDEIHECKALETDQAVAAGKLMAASKKVLLMTGTVIGGYAWHLFPILMRVSPGGLIREGIKWGQTTEFSRRYGRVARIVKVTTEGDGSGGSVRGRRSTSMRRIRSGDRRSETPKVEPGVMPSLYARHLAGRSVFLSMTDLAEHMPPIHEYIGCDPLLEDAACDRRDPYWTNTAVDMEPAQAAETKRVTDICKAENNTLLKSNNRAFLSNTLVTTMSYPDRPWDWKPPFEDDDSMPLLGQSFLGQFNHKFDPETETLHLEKGGETDVIKLRKECGVYYIAVTFNKGVTKPFVYDTGASYVSMSKALSEELGIEPKETDYDSKAQIADGSSVPVKITKIDSVTVGKFTLKGVTGSVKSSCTHSVGYWKVPRIRTKDNWQGVVTPKDLPRSIVYPKERKLIEICKREASAGNQTWVFANMTDKRDIQSRLSELLEKEGLKTRILRAKSVQTRDRIEWIEKNGKGVDVMISHPQPVMTGLDFLSKSPGGHNFNAIVFYQTGTHAFVCKQASRRGWRLIQDKRCRVYYLYYRHTMQHHFVHFMAQKFAAMSAIAGDFNMDGLIAMGGGDDGSLTLCRSIGEQLDDELMRANWEKAKGSFGELSDDDIGVANKNRCEITVEDLRRWDRIAKKITSDEWAEGMAKKFDELGLDESSIADIPTHSDFDGEDEYSDEDKEALLEPLVEAVDFGGFDDDGWLSLTEDELALLDI